MNNQAPDTGRIGGISGGKVRGVTGPALSDATPSRITVVEHVIYNTRGNQPHAVTSKFGRNQMTDEQPYERRLTLADSWIPLDAGWVETCGMIIIRNDEGRMPQRVMSAEQRADLSARIVEVYFAPTDESPVVTDLDNVIIIPPGESCRFVPRSVTRIWVRCAVKTAKTIVTVLPG